MEPEDSQEFHRLIERARHRDEAALEKLLSLHTQRLLESVRTELGARLRRRLESQDVMQQVYLDALKHIDRFVEQGHDSFFHWLRRIAINRICDADRKAFKTAKRSPELRVGDVQNAHASGINLLDRLAGSITGPITGADRAERLRLLHTAFNQLTEDHREVLRLRYLLDLSFEETAAKMERSERAVRSLCFRAVMRLRELLGDVV